MTKKTARSVVEGVRAAAEQVGGAVGQASAVNLRPPLKAKVVIYPDTENGGFTAVLPALPGCVVEGETRAELLANLREALENYLLSSSGAFEFEEGGTEEEIDL